MVVNKAGIWETSGQEQAERGLNFAYLVKRLDRVSRGLVRKANYSDSYLEKPPTR